MLHEFPGLVVASDGEADLDPGDVEGLGRPVEGHRALCDLGRETCGGVMPTFENEVGMELIGDNPQVVVEGEGGQRLDLRAPVHPAGRVVGAADH